MQPDTALPSPSDRLAMMLWHIGVAHRIGARGRICFASETAAGWNEGLVANSSRALREHLAAADPQFLSQHRFSFRRVTGCVEAVGSAWWDLDFRGKDRHGHALPFAGHDLHEVVAIVLYVIAAAGLPEPSYITDSGTGLHVVWTLRGLDRDAMTRWRALMRAMCGPRLDDVGNPPARRGRREPDAREIAWSARMLPLWRALKDLGLDRAASDPARVLRLWGSISPKNGRLVRCAWPSSYGDIHPADFDALCDAACPLTRAELRALRAERKAAREANPEAIRAPRVRRRRAAGSKWSAVYADLMRLLEHRGAAWFKDHKRRDLWALFAAVALSQTEGGDAEAWAARLGPLVGQPVRELTAALSGVERGMLANAAGETVDHDGVIRPAFYDYSIARMCAEMLITDEEAAELGLRALVPGGPIPMTPAERQRSSRDARNPDRATRGGQAEARLDLGRRAWWMRVAGMTVAQCAEELGCCVATVEKALAEADAHPDGIVSFETVDVPPMEAQAEAVSNPCDVSLLIVVPDPDPASAPLRTLPPAAQRTAPAPRTKAPPTVSPRITPADRSSAPPSPLGGSGGTGSHRGRLARPAASSGLVLTVMAMLRAEEARDRRRAARAEERRASSMPLVPLDPVREAELYREASGGGSLRRRFALVAA